jgi:pimeloyl-ACP methyl ester carboxylesterase
MKKLLKYTIYFIVILILSLFITGKANNTNITKGSLQLTDNWQGRLIDINGEKIRVVQKGEGQDILLIHGTPGSIEDWQPIIDSLSTTHRVTAFDRLGNGFSTANNYRYTIKDNVKITNQLITALGLDSVLIVGHSYGGSIAAHMATTKNDKIRSYIIVASPLYHLEPDGLFKVVAAPVIGKGVGVLISKTSVDQKIEEGLTKRFEGRTEILTDDFLAIRKQIWSQAKVLYSTSKEHINYDTDLKEVASNYSKIDSEISILYGTKDHQVIIDASQKFHNSIPHSELHILENTGHFIQFEKTAALIKVIRAHAKK